MKLFETVDDKLNNIGFVKVNEDKYGVEYERKMMNSITHRQFQFSTKLQVGMFYSLMTKI